MMLMLFWIGLTEPSANAKLASIPPECWLPNWLRSWTCTPSIGSDVFLVLSSWAKKFTHAQPPSDCEVLVAGRFLRDRSPYMRVLLVPSQMSVMRTELFM